MTTKTKEHTIRIKHTDDGGRDGTVQIDIAQCQLASALRRVIFAADPESSRYALGGVRIELMPGEITFVATDGKRLAYVKYSAAYDGKPYAFTIPLKAARELSRMYSSNNLAGLTIGKENRCVWTNGRRKVKRTEWKPLEGRFPRWQQIVVDAKTAVTAGQGKLFGKAKSLASWFEPCATIDIRANGDVTFGRAFTRCRAAKHTGEFEIAVDPQLVLEWLSTLQDKDKAVIYVKDCDSPMWCEANSGAKYVLMPMASPDQRERWRS